MSASTDIYVSPSTSLILIRNLSTFTNIYLNSFNVPNFNVSVRDTTGSSAIQVSSVTLSTIGSARFADGSFRYTLNQPYGFVNLGFRNSSFWQVLHTSGQTPQNSAANVNQLNVSTSFVTLLSSSAVRISSLLIENIQTTNAIVIDGPFVITNLSAPGIVTVQSSLNVYDDVDIDKQLFVSGVTRFYSSLNVNEISPISSVVRVFSSVGVASSLFVGAKVTVGSTLFTDLTNTIQTIQVQKSSVNATTQVADTLSMSGLLSSLLSLTVTDTYTGANTALRISQNVSTLSGTFSTQSMNIQESLFTKQNISTIQANFNTTSFGSSLRVLGPIQIQSSFVARGDFVASSFSATEFTTQSSFSTGSLHVRSGLNIEGGLSTFFANMNSLDVFSTVNTVATVSSYVLTTVKDTVYVGKNAFFDFVHLSSGFSTNSLFVGDSIQTGSTLRFKNLSTVGSFITTEPVTVDGNVSVFSTTTIENNITILGTTLISSISAQSYLLSSVYITTSSPAVAFTASSLIVSCNVNTNSVLINVTDISMDYAFASTTQFNSVEAQKITINDAITSNLFWGPRLSTNFQVSINTPSLFPNGFSTQTIFVNSLTANNLKGNFVGDGIGLSNVAVLFKNLSATSVTASSISSQLIYTSSIFASSFQTNFLTSVVSSFQSPTLAIERIGYPPRYDKNQILMLNTTLFTINNTLYIDSLQNKVGVNISSPTVDLDISGGIYTAGGLLYSSIQQFFISTLSSPLNLSTLNTGYAAIRDLYQTSTNVQIRNPNYYTTFFGDCNTLIPAFTFGTGTFDTFLTTPLNILAEPSSIILAGTVFAMNNTKRVGINRIFGNLTLALRETQYQFDMARDCLINGNAYISSVNFNSAAFTKRMTSPSLYIQDTPGYSTNSMSTNVGTLFLNNDLLVLSNSVVTKIGIKTTSMVSQGNNSMLDINGTAFFSSVHMARLHIGDTLSLSSRLL